MRHWGLRGALPLLAALLLAAVAQGAGASGSRQPVPPETPGTQLTQTHVVLLPDGTLALDYPDGWVVRGNTPVFLASSPQTLDSVENLPPGEVSLVLTSLYISDFPPDTGLRDWLTEIVRIDPRTDADGNPVITLPDNFRYRGATVINTRRAYVGEFRPEPQPDGSPDEEGLLILQQLGTRVIVLYAAAQQGSLAPYEPVLFAIAASVRELGSQQLNPLRVYYSSFEPGDRTNALWTQGSLGGGQATIRGGFYNVVSSAPGAVLNVLPASGERYFVANLYASGYLDPATSSAGSTWGITLRYLDENNYVRFAIDGAGHYSLARRVDGSWEELVPWTADEFSLYPLGEFNDLTVYDDGGYITAYINGNYVLEYDLYDEDYSGGEVGIYVASGGASSAGLLLDTFVVQEQ